MTHPDIDPSLRSAEPSLEHLDDGFSAPHTTQEEAVPDLPRDADPVSLGPKSPF